MPSAKIHEAVVREFNKNLFYDDTLLRLGTVAPDCWRNAKLFGKENKKLSHFWDYRDENKRYDYDYFYLKYYDHIKEPFYLGYLIHLITDQYWKTEVDAKYRMVKDGINGFRLKDGSFHDDTDNFEYYDGIKLKIMLANYYKLDKLPINAASIDNFDVHIDELDLTGLFGNDGSINYANEYSMQEYNDSSEIYEFDSILKEIKNVCKFITTELSRLEKLKQVDALSIKVAIDIDDTMLCTKELEELYWAQFLKDNPGADSSLLHTWGNETIIKFWSEYREKIAFGKTKDNLSYGISELKKSGYVVDALSARPLNKYASLYEKLFNYFQDNNVYLDHINLGFYEKKDFLLQHHYNILIDDNIRYINEANELGIDTILFGPHVDNYDGYQAENWNDIPSLVNMIVKKNNELHNKK